MQIKAIEEGLTFGGQPVEVDDVIEVDDVSGAFHVKRGAAIEIDADGNEVAPQEKPQEAAGATGTPDGTNTAAGSENGDSGEVAKLAKAIEGVLNKDPLIEEAQGLGIQFKFDATKGEIIQAAIDQGMGPQLLEAAKTRATTDADK